MDEEMEELFREMFVVDDFEFDFDYEYEAPRFYDFTRPETFSEAEEADCWFETASSYPPSPYIIKLNWRYDIHDNPMEIASVSCHSVDGESMTSVGIDSNNTMVFKNSSIDDDNGGLELCDHMGQDVPKSKTKSPVKPYLSRSSTLMMPTASYLAKHDQLQEFYSKRISRRFQKLLLKTDKSSQTSSVVENLATKRQKLEAGYLCKVSHLKHHALFVHKIPKKDDVNSCARSKVTIPREPNLETAHRAQRYRCKANAESGENAKSKACTFKAHPLNRKILESPRLPRPKKSSLQLTEFQVFQLRTSERARQHARNKVAPVYDYEYISQIETKDYRRLNSFDTPKKEKCEVKQYKAQSVNKKILSSKGEPGVFSNIKQETAVSLENNMPIEKRSLNEPLAGQFSKLSIASEVQANLKSLSKTPVAAIMGSKENAPASFHLEHEMIKAAKDRSPRFFRNQYQCGSGRRITEVGSQINTNRKLDIR
ncbi:hypothetical protein Ddye_013507 [Dipteronia dyeriana]|uniref:TPX2 central domain-containing protein n=1 Tax=Dipteronia dyeriana TaxID=168575 RepID=A0AAE0CJP9_9ROSI|nr:hypothetical protein Ddye_013507 [Dipteronia dyeriana]